MADDAPRPLTDPRDRWLYILGPVLVTNEGFGGIQYRFHPSHDLGSLYCRGCGLFGTDRGIRRPCKALRETGIGL